MGPDKQIGVSYPTPSLGVKFVSAGLAASIADLITFPLDTAKVRLQIQGEKSLITPTSIIPKPSSSISPSISFPNATTKSAATATTKQSTPAATTTPGARTLITQAEAPQLQAPRGFKYRGIFRTMYVISAEEGVRALYNGLIAGLHRQLCFASIRIGLYDNVKNAYIGFFFGDKPQEVSGSNVTLRILAGITTGASAVLLAQPTDVVKVRMQAQNRGLKVRYSGTLHAYRTIAVEEGVKGLWKGVLPNIARNAIVNAAELVSYDLIKEAILHHKLLSDNMPCHFVSAFGAGFCTTVVASPVDVVKTRYMNSASGVYKGAWQCALVMFKEGGPFAFYKGFMPSFVRLGSWNICMFVTFEQLKRLFARIQ